MKKFFVITIGILGLFCQISFTSSLGSFFNIAESGTTIPAEKIILCLNGYGPLTCQNYTISHAILSINTVVPNHAYNSAGIKITSGLTIAGGCTLIKNGYCIFSVSAVNSAVITLGVPEDPLPFASVGYYTTSAALPLSYYTNNGGKDWITSTTLPPLYNSSSFLNAIACDTSSQICTAVGYAQSGFNSAPVTYFSINGGKDWSLSSTLPPFSGFGGELTGVACSSDGQKCTAVGMYSPTLGLVNRPFAYYTTNGGVDWTIATTLPPQQGGINSENRLRGVNCDSSGEICTAIGEYNNGGVYAALSYVSTNGGIDWLVSTTLPPPAPGSQDNILYSVACDSTGQLCTSVGLYYIGSDSFPLTYVTTNGGIDWTLSSTLPPALGTPFSDLLGVSCDTTGQLCTAVGHYTSPSGSTASSYYSTDGGINWLVSTTLPPQLGLGTILQSVICDSTGLRCSAVGYYHTISNSYAASYFSTNGGKDWITSTTLPPPIGTINLLYGAA